MEPSCSSAGNALVLLNESVQLLDRLVLSIRGDIELGKQQVSRFSFGSISMAFRKSGSA
jgi:hypothetical protein